MRFSLPSIALFVMFATSIARAQTPSGPSNAYQDLLVTPAAAQSDAATPLTIVPPAHPVETTPILEGAVVSAQPWESGGVAYPPVNAPMSHTIAAEPWDGGWFGAVELTIFRPVFDDVPVVDREGSVGPRLILGWESDRGFGVRTRFWGLENEAQLDVMGLALDQQFEAFRFDLELYREFDFKGSSITVGGALRPLKSNRPFNPSTPLPKKGRRASAYFSRADT